MYKCFVGSLPNIVAFQPLFVGCLTHDSTKVPTSTFKSRHHQKKASPFFPLPQPLIMSCSSSLDLSKAPTHWHLHSSSEKLEEPWNIAGLLQVIKIFRHTTPFFQAIETKLIDSSHRQCQASSQQQNAWYWCGEVHSWRRVFSVTSNWGRDVYQRCPRKEDE